MGALLNVPFASADRARSSRPARLADAGGGRADRRSRPVARSPAWSTAAAAARTAISTWR